MRLKENVAPTWGLTKPGDPAGFSPTNVSSFMFTLDISSLNQLG